MYREYSAGQRNIQQITLREQICQQVRYLPPLTVPMGNNGIPCRTVRIFISSTFKDFYNERDVLVKKVFPRLRDFCEQNGLFLVECDLRWGVPKDATNVQAILTCIDEIQRSIEEMNGENFFLGLVGDRYGWAPAPDVITPQIRNKYQWIDDASVTMMEMVHGALRTMSPNALLMLRESGRDFFAQMPPEHRAVFTESEADLQQKVALLQDVLRHYLEPCGQFHTYKSRYTGVTKDAFSGRERVELSDLEEFEEKVCSFFQEAIVRTFKLSASTDEDSESPEKQLQRLNEEQTVLLSALTHAAMNSVQLSDDFHVIAQDPQSYLNVSIIVEETSVQDDEEEKVEQITLNGNAVVCLQGPAGSGKSTMMAALLQNLIKSGANTAERIFFHFCGASIGSKSEMNMLQRLRATLLQLQPNKPEITVDGSLSFTDLVSHFGAYHSPGNCFLLIDALDEMDSNWRWLPSRPLPTNVVCIFSCLNNENSSTLRSKMTESITKVLLMPQLGESQGRHYVTTLFNDYGKKLDQKDTDSLFEHESAHNPLWLSLACEEMRMHGDYASLSRLIRALPDNIDALYQQILRRVIQQDSENLTKLFLQLLYISRAGLWEQEVAAMLAYFAGLEHVSLAKVTDLFRTLKPFIHLVGAPVPIIKLRHRIVSEVLQASVFQGENADETQQSDGEHSKETIATFHVKMGDYYENPSQDDLNNSKKASLSVNKRFLEMVFHRHRAGQRAAVINAVVSPTGNMVFNSHLRSQLLNHYRCCMMVTPTRPGVKKEEDPSIMRACHMCLMQRHMMHQDVCYICGMPSFQSSKPASICNLHQNSIQLSSCGICGCFTPSMNLKALKLCMMCGGMSFCSVFVKETDFFYRNTARNYGNVDFCFAIDP